MQADIDVCNSLRDRIRDVPGFPKEGITFKDITPLLADPGSLALAVELMANPFRKEGVELVAGAESRGFIFGTAVAQALSAGFVPIRKPGKLPSAIHSVEYGLEYGTDRVEIHQDAILPGQRILMVDDLLATGGTMRACCELVERLQGQIIGTTVLIELSALQGRSRLGQYGDVHAVLVD
jgi:adenine phosphoribosyltransferase